MYGLRLLPVAVVGVHSSEQHYALRRYVLSAAYSFALRQVKCYDCTVKNMRVCCAQAAYSGVPELIAGACTAGARPLSSVAMRIVHERNTS